MPIVKADSLKEAYKFRSISKDINELNGRGDLTYLTDFIAANIANNLNIKSNDTIIDIGCGDCSFFKELRRIYSNANRCNLIGILPNPEEIKNVQNNIKENFYFNDLHIDLREGQLGDLNIKQNLADIAVLNSVLHGVVKNLPEAIKIFLEIKNILKNGGIFYLGEIPEIDELGIRNYDPDSIVGWLIWVLKNRGVREFLKNFLKVIRCIFTKELFIIEPKKRFFINPEELVKQMHYLGFKCLKKFPHQQIDKFGKVNINNSRWNFIFQISK